MSMRRFFFNTEDRTGDTVLLSAEESHHLVKVLRLQPGDRVELLDGAGGVYQGVVTRLDRRVQLVVEKTLRMESQGKNLRVYQGILKGEKMDTVVQKCTELGVTSFAPNESSRCQGRLSVQQRRKKFARWQRIGLNACKQCLRSRPMQLDMPAAFRDVISRSDGHPEEVRLLFWEDENDVHLHNIPDLGKQLSVGLLLGPEGGLTVQEVAMAKDQGFIAVSLGQRILRAETAALAAVSIVQYLSGNL